jgi:hypothetical protein
VIVTSFLGSYLSCVGVLIICDLWPVDYQDNKSIIITTIFVTIIFACAGMWVQSQRIKKFNQMVKARMLIQYLNLDEEA